MDTIDPTPDDKPVPWGRRYSWLPIGAIGLILLAFAIWASPTYSFHPLCTYSVNAEVAAQVTINGQTLSSRIVHQASHSRGWIGQLNSAGCQPLVGRALIFKLADDRVLIVPARMCQKAKVALAGTGRVDVLSLCTGQRDHRDLAFLVDSATRPTTWYTAANGVGFQINSMTAASTWREATNDIASVAPSLLKSDFKYGHQLWSRSPETVISFQRRYDQRRHNTDQAYEFEVKDGGPLR